MKLHSLFAAASMFGLCGCVNLFPPADKTLVEKTLQADPGWAVFDKVAIIDVGGMIINEQQGGLLTVGENPTSLFLEKIKAAEADDRVRAVVLRIDSPGGTVTASDLMYDALVRLKQKKEAGGGKFPIVAMMMGTAASGGYYIAMAADEVHAMPGTITGSIGVLLMVPDLSGLMDKLGLKVKVIKSGPNKDSGSPLRPLGAGEEKYFQDEIVKRYYDRFIDKVAAARGKKGLTRDKVLALADGRIYLGPAAKEHGLIDEVGTLEEAIEAAAKAAGIAGRKRVVLYHRPMSWRGTVYAQAPTGPTQPQINMININADRLWMPTVPQFLYLWQPQL
jgi:protease-4